MSVKPNAHRRRRRRDLSVELSRVGGVNGPRNSHLATVSTSRNKFANNEVKLRRVGGVNPPVRSVTIHNDVIVEKVISIDQNSRSQTAMESVWTVSKLSTDGSRRKLVANSVHTADTDATQLDN